MHSTESYDTKMQWSAPVLEDLNFFDTQSGGDLNPWENTTTSTLQKSS